MSLRFRHEGENVALYAANRRKDAAILRRKSELLLKEAETIEAESYVLENNLSETKDTSHDK